MWLQSLRQKLDHWYDDRITELPVSLGIRDGDLPAPLAAIKSHQTRAFQRS